MQEKSFKIAKGLKVVRGTVKKQKTNLLPKKKKRK